MPEVFGSFPLILCLGIAAVGFSFVTAVATYLSSFSVGSRIKLLIMGNSLCLLCLLCEIYHTWGDAVNFNSSCIYDTAHLLLICSVILVVIVALLSSYSLSRILREVREL